MEEWSGGVEMSGSNRVCPFTFPGNLLQEIALPHLQSNIYYDLSTLHIRFC